MGDDDWDDVTEGLCKVGFLHVFMRQEGENAEEMTSVQTAR